MFFGRLLISDYCVDDTNNQNCNDTTTTSTHSKERIRTDGPTDGRDSTSKGKEEVETGEVVVVVDSTQQGWRDKRKT